MKIPESLITQTKHKTMWQQRWRLSRMRIYCARELKIFLILNRRRVLRISPIYTYTDTKLKDISFCIYLNLTNITCPFPVLCLPHIIHIKSINPNIINAPGFVASFGHDFTSGLAAGGWWAYKKSLGHN